MDVVSANNEQDHRHIFWFVVLLFGFFAVATIWLTKPFIGHHDWDNVRRILLVNNYLRYGYTQYHALQIQNLLPVDAEGIGVYRSAPPTLAIILSLSARAFSLHEAFIRLPNIFITMLSISMMYRFTYSVFYKRRLALLAAAFFALSSFTLYFARVAMWEPGHTLIAITMMFFYVRWWRRPRRKHLIVLGILAFVGLWYSNFIAFLLIALFAHSLLQGNKNQRLATFVVGIIGLIGLGTFFFYTTDWFNADVIEETINNIQYRASSETVNRGETYTILEYVLLFIRRLFYGTSPFLLLFSVIGFLALRRRSEDAAGRPVLFPVMILLSAALLYTTVWRNATFLHDFFMYTFTPPLAILAGYGLDSIWRGNRTWIARTRSQRFAGAFVLGHLVLTIFVMRILIYTSSDLMLWVADNIAERTVTSDQVATNLEYFGPNIMWYAQRNITYEIDEETSLAALFEEEDFTFYLLCDPQNPPDTWPEDVHVEAIEDCFAITPAAQE